MRIQKLSIRIIGLVLVIALGLSTSAMATVTTGISILRYINTERVDATLNIDGNIARCSGYIFLSDNYDCSITIALYRQSGSKWSKVIAWSKNSTGGASAILTQTFTLTTNGNYKVVTTGKVNGESCRAESKVVSYQGQ